MCGQNVFDFTRRNVFATAHDHVVGAAGEKQIAFAIDISGIPRGKPAIGIKRAALFVLAGNLFAAYIDFAALALWQLAAIGIADFDFDGGEWSPGGTQSCMHIRIGRFVRSAMVFRSQQRDGRTRFCQAISVGEIRFREKIQRAVDQFQRHTSTAIRGLNANLSDNIITHAGTIGIQGQSPNGFFTLTAIGNQISSSTGDGINVTDLSNLAVAPVTLTSNTVINAGSDKC